MLWLAGLRSYEDQIFGVVLSRIVAVLEHGNNQPTSTENLIHTGPLYLLRKALKTCAKKSEKCL